LSAGAAVVDAKSHSLVRQHGSSGIARPKSDATLTEFEPKASAKLTSETSCEKQQQIHAANAFSTSLIDGSKLSA